jgi:hypothetical protein
MRESLRTAAEIIELALKQKPELIIQGGDLPATVRALRDLLAKSGRLFDRGMPVRVVTTAEGGPPSAVPLTKNNVVIEAHHLCQPMKVDKQGGLVPFTLPDRAAQMYLDMTGEWHLHPLDGISMSPLLSDDGSFRVADGYDQTTRLWCSRVPDVLVKPCPSRNDAETAMLLLRQAFRTFPFGDAVRTQDSRLGVETVDLCSHPGRDESAFLAGLLTACCRPSLWLAPGLVLTAPNLSGAGCGKGLLVRAICMIAFGISPRAFTSGNDRQELDKRLAAELVEALPALFLDNANGVALRSDTLASVITERPARVRVLGQTRMVPLNSTAFMAVTGNGLTVTEDLARRFISCELDARCEDPESRPFPTGFLDDIKYRRAELLAAVLTIWRWGRQNAPDLPKGKPLGSFEKWAVWCRDPLLALGCRDPVERIETLKARDPRRQRIAELFSAWWEHHGDTSIKVNELAEPVKLIADAQGRGRQYLATSIAGMAGTHAAGFVLTRQEAAGKWKPATYSLRHADAADPIGHRTHRTHRPLEAGTIEPERREDVPATAEDPMSPMSPMPYATADDEIPPNAEAEV